MTATTLDTFYKTNTTLSGGNLVATSVGAGAGARSSRAICGLTYFEGVITTLTGTPNIGIATTNWDHTSAMGAAGTTNSLGYLPSGVVQVAGVTLSTIAAYVQGNRIGVAVDPSSRLIWFRVNGGNWNNNVANDPVAEVGGIDYSSMTSSGSLIAGILASLTGNVWTMDFSTPFTNAAPTGYASLDTLSTIVKSITNPTEVPAFVSPASFIGANPSIDQTTHGKHFSPAGAITVVSGTTKEAGVAVAGRRVDVYDRFTGDLLGTTNSDGSGNWSIPCLGRPAVRVVGSDPTTFNSMVFDDVVPV